MDSRAEVRKMLGPSETLDLIFAMVMRDADTPMQPMIELAEQVYREHFHENEKRSIVDLGRFILALIFLVARLIREAEKLEEN
jgi:hypothetical protein